MIVFLTGECTPSKNHPDSSEIGGAFVSCWVRADALAVAETIARRKLVDQHWILDEFDDLFEVDRESFVENPEHLRYFDQAIKDGEVYLFNAYPIVEILSHAV